MIALLTTDDAARILGVTPRRVRALAGKRKIGRRLSGVWVFTADEVEQLRPGKVGRPKKEGHNNG